MNRFYSAILFLITIILTKSVCAYNPIDQNVIVQFMEWKWTDIALECERRLAKDGYTAVQISPPNEHVYSVYKDQRYPWWIRYQVVSYKLESRSGTREELIDMVRRCKAVGVDVYADVILNHMAADYATNDSNPPMGYAGSVYRHYDYEGLYGFGDFHHIGGIGDYYDRFRSQNGELCVLADLATEKEHVRYKLAEYLNDLLSIGIAGFRVDAAKHVPAEDLENIFSRLNKQPSFIGLEFYEDPRQPIHAWEYLPFSSVTEVRYSEFLTYVFQRGKLNELVQVGKDGRFLPDVKVMTFLHNHDMQREDDPSRFLTYRKDGQNYILANTFLLAWPYGLPRVMSGFDFKDKNDPPPIDDNGNLIPVYENGKANNCKDGMWTCEHRLTQIKGMVGFRKVVGVMTQVNNLWTNGGNIMAFSRGNKGFLVINKEDTDTQRWFNTGLPQGKYCNVLYSSGPKSKRCVGPAINVNEHGWAEILVKSQDAVAIHVSK